MVNVVNEEKKTCKAILQMFCVMADHLPIQVATRCGAKMCVVKYHVSEDKSNIVESSGGVQTLRNVGAYYEPAWDFDAKFVDRQAHTRANVHKAPGHGHFLEMKNSAYHCPYDLIQNKVNAIYIVYKIRDYDSTGTEHNSLFSCGMSDNHRGICFLKDEKRVVTTGGHGAPFWVTFWHTFAKGGADVLRGGDMLT